MAKLIKDIPLDAEEQDLKNAIDHGDLIQFPDVTGQKATYQAYARQAVKQLKKQNINIRLSEADLSTLKTRAARSGIPYQTLISSLIHQYTTDEITLKL